MNRGIVMVNTGDGKGKSTASIGLIVRALGHDQKVSFIQFIKSGHYGEHNILSRFAPLLDVKTMGAGFTNRGDKEDHKRAALEAWEYAKEVILAGKHDLIVLDEFTYCLKYGYLKFEELKEVLDKRESYTSVVITGRDASSELIELADMVSEVKMVKHHYQAGVKAQKGVEF